MPKGLTDKERHRNVSKECQALRDLVNKLKLELLQSQVEAQKVRDQLQCVIYLVRRAWQGDETASIHVSNIVGVAPPRIQKNPELDEFTVTPKSKVLNGWARLVIGLLNRIYHEEELELRAKQLLYMRDREELLDEQLMSHNAVTQHSTSASLVQATDAIQMLQAKEEQLARERAEEREQLQQQRQELQTRLRKPTPFALNLHGSTRKDTAQRQAEIDSSENLVVVPVRKRNENVTSLEVDAAEHVRSQTREGAAGKKTNSQQQRPRPITASVKSSRSSVSVAAAKRRPFSAHSLTAQPKTRNNSPPGFDSNNTAAKRQQLDVIERDLKRTTKALQDRLGISKQGFV